MKSLVVESGSKFVRSSRARTTMTSISALAINKTLDHAFRAAFMLTGRADLAENCVLDGIACLESRDDIEKTLVANTVESAIQKCADFTNQLEHSLTLLPAELHRLTLLPPVVRHAYMCRTLFGIRPARCAAILDLTIEEFEASLCVAYRHLFMVEEF